MENPVKEIPYLIHSLTQGSSDIQKQVLDTYFMPNCAFLHPFCRVDSLADILVSNIGIVNSRWLIWMIYRWYRFLSPRTVLEVHSAVLDHGQNILYVQVSQEFSVWFIPFYHAHVHLVTMLHLTRSPYDHKYYICKQEDHYQLNEVVKFFWPYGNVVLTLWQFMTTFFCVMGSLIFAHQES
ncbi:hypothetical protein BKA57DRAFT_476145 [Linnemannia elongata]|nr:hypothetical protein BKA57DRAFT_476145 [Linnemannia elongata]